MSTPSNEELLLSVTEKIVKAVPERWELDIPDDCQSPITLEDVLIALLTPEACADDTDYCQMCGQGNLDHVVFTLCRDKWILGSPLSSQSPETISFLESIL